MTITEISELTKDILSILGGVGGVGVIFVFLLKLLSSIWRDWRKVDLGAKKGRATKYYNTQYDNYLELWQQLQRLSLLVDAVWNVATLQNIENLAHELANTKEKVNNWSLSFDENHYAELLKLFTILENYEVGKVRLVEIRNEEDINKINTYDITSQIERNQEYKKNFNKLLEDIRKSFRNKLSILS